MKGSGQKGKTQTGSHVQSTLYTKTKGNRDASRVPDKGTRHSLGPRNFIPKKNIATEDLGSVDEVDHEPSSLSPAKIVITLLTDTI